MKLKILAPLGCVLLLALTGCQGTRASGGYYTVHAESFRIFGFAIPGDDQAAAAKLHAEKYPNGAVTSNNSTPADWTSFWGVLGNIIGFHRTEISGKTN